MQINDWVDDIEAPAKPVVLSTDPDWLTQISPDANDWVDDVQMGPINNQIQPQGYGRTALDQGMQGSTFGFADEAMDAMGALGAGSFMRYARPDLMEGQNLDTLYNEARNNSKQRLAQQTQQLPEIAIPANIAGALIAGGAGAATKTGKTAINSIRGGNAGARIAKGAAAGGASGGLYGYGTGDENRLESAGEGALLGAGIGAGIPAIGAAGGAAIRVAAPKIEEGLIPVVELAQKYKIPVALSQVSEGNAMKNFQKVSKELPFSGETQFRDKQFKAFNKALISTAGGNSNKFSPELMDGLFSKLGKEFDDFGKGKKFDLNNEFVDATRRLMDESEPYTKEGQDKLKEGIAKIFSNADEDGVIAGEKLSKIRAQLNANARKAGAVKNYEAQEIFRDLENTVIDIVKAGDDDAGKAFSKTKQRYKNLIVLEPLAQKAKAGNVSPSLLQNRVARIYGRDFTRGKAGEIGDLARIGHEILPEVGGSDTVQKALYAGGLGSLGTAALMNPPLALAGAAKAGVGLGLNRAIQEGINRNQSVIAGAAKRSQPLRLTITPQDKYLP